LTTDFLKAEFYFLYWIVLETGSWVQIPSFTICSGISHYNSYSQSMVSEVNRKR